MTSSHSLSAETLGRITVLQSMVTLLPNAISMLDFVCHGLKDITGVTSLTYRLFNRSTPPAGEPVQLNETMRVFPIKYNAITYAELNFAVAESEAFDPYIPFLQNFVNMLGVVFEGQSQRKVNETLLAELEHRVAERTSELREKTEDLRITLNSIGDAVISTDIYGNVTNMNPVAEKLTGWQLADGKGKILTEVFHIVNIATLQPALNPVKRVLATGEIVGLANHTSLIAKDGSRYHIADSAAPIRDIDGNICGVVLVFRDVSDEYRIAEALKSSEERFLLAMKASNDGLFDWNLETNDIYYSPAWKKMLGYEDHELPNDFSVWENTTAPEDVKKSWELQQKLISRQIERFVLEFKMKHKDGQWVDILSRAEALFNESGQAIRIVGTHTDITERKQAEEQLRKSEEQFRNLFDEAPVGYFEYDLQGNITRVNHTYLKMLGYTAKEVLGQPCWKFIVDEVAREQILAKLDGVRPPALGLERTYRRKDGTTFPVLFDDRLLLAVDGHIMGIRTAFQDITELKLSEAEREKLREQLNQAQKMESVGRLAGGVAHDFNNMLGVILGHAEMALEDLDSAVPLYANLQAIQYAAERSAALARQLLTFARKQTVAPRVIDLNQTIEGMLKMLRRLIGENINLIWMPGSSLWPINMDPSQIDQILANLCVNGRDAIVGVGKITVETRNATFDKEYCATHEGTLPGEYVRITVSDTGRGMNKETLAHIFEPFFTTKDVGEGTGLGLATVYGAVKQNNGFINAYSEPGQGTTLTIYIPRHVETTTEARPTAPPEPVVRGNEIVMLVEDEPTLLQMSKTMLERLGYTVLAAGTPNEAIHLAEKYSGHIHLLATDVIMPEMNGRELSERLLESRPGMKCLFMSGYTANIIASQGVLQAGKSFIQKPFSKNELANKVREALQG